MRVLFDTSALIALFLKESGWQRVLALLQHESVDVLLASVSVTEFARRLHTLHQSAPQIDIFVREMRALITEVVAIDEAIAELAFELYRATPERLPTIDSLIAAAASSHGAVLVHRDAHFKTIPASLLLQEYLG